MTPQQAENLLELARQAVNVAEQHKRQLILAPSDVKNNLNALRTLIQEIDRTA